MEHTSPIEPAYNSPKSLIPLSSLCVGQRATVVTLGACHPALCSKLTCMGLVPGLDIEVQHFAPLGDPMTVSIFGSSQLALRLAEAEVVIVQPH